MPHQCRNERRESRREIPRENGKRLITTRIEGRTMVQARGRRPGRWSPDGRLRTTRTRGAPSTSPNPPRDSHEGRAHHIYFGTRRNRGRPELQTTVSAAELRRTSVLIIRRVLWGRAGRRGERARALSSVEDIPEQSAIAMSQACRLACSATFQQTSNGNPFRFQAGSLLPAHSRGAWCATSTTAHTSTVIRRRL